MRISKVKSIHDESKPFTFNDLKCKTCAYHTPPSPEEIEMESDMRMLRPDRHHACHERANSWCCGSVEFQKMFCDV